MDKRKRVRFGCTLAPDVMDILNANGRDESKLGDRRLTRTQIIEVAVREWAAIWGQSNGQPHARSDAEPDPEAEQAAIEKRAQRKAARQTRKQELAKTVSEALPGRISNAGAETNIPVRPFQSFPKPGKK